MLIKKNTPLKGTVTVPCDKSIAHRAFFTASICSGESIIRIPVCGLDCLTTIHCMRSLGISITMCKEGFRVIGNGMHGLKPYSGILSCDNSGTTARLLMGLLSAQSFETSLSGDASLNQRPMKRVTDPLSLMGASFHYHNQVGVLPLTIQPAPLNGIHFDMIVSSAQVKSAIIYAALYADSPTIINEPVATRNHTEIFLHQCGAQLHKKSQQLTIHPADILHPFDLKIPGDFSSAAYFITAASIVPNSEVRIRQVNVNPTRVGFLKVVKQMGGKFKLQNKTMVNGEPVADLIIQSASLKGITVDSSLIPSMIDEIPLIAILACFAEGTTIIHDASELRYKESDRIHAIVENLQKMGADIIEYDDGFAILGGQPLHGTTISTYKDHRIAMSFSIAALMADGEVSLDDWSCVSISYPEFFQDLLNLTSVSINDAGKRLLHQRY